jgi:hypothetical protein
MTPLQDLPRPSMTSASVYLPSEALKAVFAFMTRKQLIALSWVNRRFYSAINSPPRTMKPLRRIGSFSIRRTGYWLKEQGMENSNYVEEWRMGIDGRSHWRIMGDRFSAAEGAACIEQIISLQWMRFKSEFYPSRKHSSCRFSITFQKSASTCHKTTRSDGTG